MNAEADAPTIGQPPIRKRVRPTVAEGKAMQTEIERLENALADARQELDAMRRRISKWSTFALFVGFIVGGVCGRMFV